VLEQHLHVAGGVVVASESVCGAYEGSSLCCVAVSTTARCRVKIMVGAAGVVTNNNNSIND